MPCAEADSIASELRSPRASQRQQSAKTTPCIADVFVAAKATCACTYYPQAAEVPFVEEVHLKVPVKLAAPTCRVSYSACKRVTSCAPQSAQFE
eukprot:4827875-Amphidinium_carterae.2